MVGRVGEHIMEESLMIVQVFPIRQTVLVPHSSYQLAALLGVLTLIWFRFTANFEFDFILTLVLSRRDHVKLLRRLFSAATWRKLSVPCFSPQASAWERPTLSLPVNRVRRGHVAGTLSEEAQSQPVSSTCRCHLWYSQPRCRGLELEPS